MCPVPSNFSDSCNAKPERTCYMLELEDYAIVALLLLLSQADSPVPGPADADAIGLGGLRYARLLELLKYLIPVASKSYQ